MHLSLFPSELRLVCPVYETPVESPFVSSINAIVEVRVSTNPLLSRRLRIQFENR